MPTSRAFKELNLFNFPLEKEDLLEGNSVLVTTNNCD